MTLIIINFFLVFFGPGNCISSSPNVMCTHPEYFNQTQWIEDSTGSEGYKYSLMSIIESDSSLIDAPKLLIECVFLDRFTSYSEHGIEYLSYDWFYNGYTCAIIFKFRDGKVFEVRHFKGCG
ncbi:MAG: hypothetical protein ACI80H_001902 [Pseudoalteromonas distincta]|jgi:hypothetical protein